jgi:hypothetical protein
MLSVSRALSSIARPIASSLVPRLARQASIKGKLVRGLVAFFLLQFAYLSPGLLFSRISFQ